MRSKITLISSAVICAIALTACGGSSDSNSNSGNNNGGQVTPVSDLDKAKNLIKTTNNIISYFDSFDSLQSQYDPTFKAINYSGNDVGNATGLVLILAALAYEDAQGSEKSYNAAALQKLLDDEDYIDYQLSNSNLSVQVKSDSVTISGSADVKYWVDYEWNPGTQQYKDIFGEDATVTVTALKLEAPFDASQAAYNFKIVAGGKIATKNKANKTASFSFKDDSTANVVYTTVKKLENRNGDEHPKTAQFKFSNLEFAAQNVVITLKEFSAKAQQATLKNETQTKAQLIPTEFTLKGETKLTDATDSLGLEASIKLNNNLTGTIDVSNGESATAFINADVAIKLSGNVKAGGTTVKPFSIDLIAKRSEYQKGTATVNVAVDKDKLKVDVSTNNLTAQEPKVSAKVSHENGAYVDIADVESFSTADIKVGSTKYGTVNKISNGGYSATFTDNTSILIAP